MLQTGCLLLPALSVGVWQAGNASLLQRLFPTAVRVNVCPVNLGMKGGAWGEWRELATTVLPGKSVI